MNSASRWLFLVWCCTTRELQFEFLICIFSFPSTFLQALPSNLQGFISLRYFAHSFAFHLMVYGSLITLRQKVRINIQCTLEQLPIKVSPHLFFFKKKNHYSILSWLRTSHISVKIMIYFRWNNRKNVADLYVSHVVL